MRLQNRKRPDSLARTEPISPLKTVTPVGESNYNLSVDGYITSLQNQMKPTLKTVKSFIIVQVAILALASFMCAEEVDGTEIEKRLEASANVLDQMMSSQATTIPSQVLAEAECIAVVPSLVNVALGVGGRHGKGVATCRTSKGNYLTRG